MGYFFGVSVKEENSKIYVKSLHAKNFHADIDRIFKTSRVGKYMFTLIGRTSFVIDSFFALELYYICDKIIKNRYRRSNVKDLKSLQEELMKNTWLGKTEKEFPPRLDFSRLKNLTLEPLEFQDRFLKHYDTTVPRYNLNGMLLAGTAGSGKTFITLALHECLNKDRVVVICPKNAVYTVWQKSILSLFKKEQSVWIYDQRKPYKNERFLIFHYEGLETAYDMIDEIMSVSNIGVTLDESHNLNEIVSLRTQRFIDFCDRLKCQDVILASGTPIKAMSLEAIPLFRAIDPLFTKEVEEKFRRMYAGNVSAVTELLSQRINNVSFKIEKTELNLDKPIFNELKVVIPDGERFTLKAIAIEMEAFITKQQKYYKSRIDQDTKDFFKLIEIAYNNIQQYRFNREEERLYSEYQTNLQFVMKSYKNGSIMSASKEIVACNRYEKTKVIPNLSTKEQRDQFKEIRSIVKYVGLKIQGECLGRILGRQRIDVSIAMLPYIPFDEIFNSTEKKTVVFTSYVEVLENLNTQLKSDGLNPLVVYGKANDEVNTTVKAFERSSDLNPLIATYASLSTAVPLVMADTMIMVNVPFRDYVFQQAVSRCHRLGADTQVCVYTVSLDTGNEINISSRTLDILKWSQDQIEKIMDMDVPFKLEEGEESISIEALDETLIKELKLPSFIMEELPLSVLTKW